MVEMIFKIPVLVNKEIQQNIECEKFKIYDILFLNFAALNFLIRKIKIRLWIWKNFSVIPYPISTTYPAINTKRIVWNLLQNPLPKCVTFFHYRLNQTLVARIFANDNERIFASLILMIMIGLCFKTYTNILCIELTQSTHMLEKIRTLLFNFQNKKT